MSSESPYDLLSFCRPACGATPTSDLEILVFELRTVRGPIPRHQLCPSLIYVLDQAATLSRAGRCPDVRDYFSVPVIDGGTDRNDGGINVGYVVVVVTFDLVETHRLSDIRQRVKAPGIGG